MTRAGKSVGARVAAYACAAMAAGLCGCAIVAEEHVLASQFTESQVRTIRNGQTSKKEILDRLGPPAALARPAGGAADNVLRRFAAAGSLAGPLVYRYDDSALAWGNLCVYGQGGGGCIPSKPLLKERTLWILIDEKTGRVADHVVEESERMESGVLVRPWPGP